ncbi:MAG: hypothetical protein SF182_06145 [Deltaproteobacteria bacterium]|nr:hypothetical protein [Deltaproteobacteria bacterium]
MHTLRTLLVALSMCGALATPLTWSAATAQEITPAISDGGPRSGPEPVEPHPLAYGLVTVMLLVGFGIGVVAVVVIRTWDRSRPIERRTEERQRPHAL